MRWAFWRKEPDPPPRQVSRRFPKKESSIQHAPQPDPGSAEPPDVTDELAPMEEAPASTKRKSKAPPVKPDHEPGALPAPPPTPSGGVPAIGRSTERLGDLLVRSGAISPDALEKALDTQRELRADTYLGEILIRENVIDEEKLAETISQQYRIPLIRMDGHEFKKDLLSLLTPEDAWRLRAIPTDKLGRILSVAMTNPLDERATAELARITGLKIKPLIAIGSELRRALDFVYPDRAPSTAPRARSTAPLARSTPAPGAPQRSGGNTGLTGRVVPPAPDTGTKPAHFAASANTLLRRVTKPPEQTVTPVEANADRLEAEAVTDDVFAAGTSSNPEYILRRVPEPGLRRRATPATPIGDAEFLLFVGSLPRPRP
ncbi:MAG: type IV pilus assembly protein [Planctomycetota bacterium]|nr:MAG: type IV pilus assembly protein [Planctomycetota bacterium]